MNRSATPFPDGRGPEVAVALTIAGSDSGGGAGIQADLKAFAARGIFGASAIACLTAQNPKEVRAIEGVSLAMLRAQIAAVFAEFPVAAVKTGMLFSAERIEATADELAARQVANLVVDPVMVATSGAGLLREDAIETLRRRLLPLCRIVTPNLPEAEILAGHPIRTRTDQRHAAQTIAGKYGIACVVKGGHFAAGAARPAVLTDILARADGRVEAFDAPAVTVRETHGTGCTFSAALTAGLALGQTLSAATAAAQAYVGRALATAVRAGRHFPLGWNPNPRPAPPTSPHPA